MGRKPHFSNEEIVAAGERLMAAGAEVNKFALRMAVGGGNPARLWQIWQAHAALAPPNGPAREPRRAATGPEPRRPGTRKPDTTARRRNDPESTRRDVLEAAIHEFAAKGLSGARVDAIAARTRTTKRSIYYHFGSKDGLYVAVLEAVYGRIRAIEQNISLSALPPVEAMRKLIEFTFDYQNDNPDFNRLVTIENIHFAKHLKRSTSIRNLNVSVIETIREILARGRQSGVFVRDVDPIDLHMMISAYCFFRMSNRYTFSEIFGVDLSEAEARRRHKTALVEMILSYLMHASDATAKPGLDAPAGTPDVGGTAPGPAQVPPPRRTRARKLASR
ncbi:TetR family transcriptional regulator [Arenibaculum pallidiluteum]|uniref:TetR family transcriptional regulator n=1 Tax=Arenibaculum pallidiluteum TaxID=2812559 RepID=UPI001F463EA7|nr:TetR family transcriptional regulator [Arenibaculum pallidiluteum]